MQKESSRKRTIQKILRLSKEENEYLTNKIETSPFDNFQNFARIMLITGEIRHVDYSELIELNQQVSRIGNNINQMARLAHQFDEISSEDIQQLLSDVSNLQKMVSSSLKKEIQRGK